MKLADFDYRLWHKPSESFMDMNVSGTDLRIIPNDCDIEIELWTGMRDKNGKKIYEGDIVKLKDGIYRVWLKNGFFLEDNADNVYTMWFASKYGEVVGNIHENKDL
ncbi:hypothetical protein T36_1281 [Helicobacter cinaedi]|uniref:YopX family protein n=1 Tax=Helicobacter cinaedi TaxID=213 RepID=UPI001F161C78|nr:YopX family protein [Helicobacter cinaedi]BDB64824.1 hypothetical protein T36_1281 [Helicobacter cinaedi]